MRGYDPSKAPTSVTQAYHDLRVQATLMEAMAQATERGYMERAYLLAARMEEGSESTEFGKSLWRWLPTHRKLAYLDRARKGAGLPPAGEELVGGESGL